MGLGATALRLAAGLEMLFAGSPVQTLTTCDLYTSSFLTVSSLRNVICASLSFFFWYSMLRGRNRQFGVRGQRETTHAGPILTSTDPLVRWRRCVTSSVLK